MPDTLPTDKVFKEVTCTLYLHLLQPCSIFYLTMTIVEPFKSAAFDCRAKVTLDKRK